MKMKKPQKRAKKRAPKVTSTDYNLSFPGQYWFVVKRLVEMVFCYHQRDVDRKPTQEDLKRIRLLKDVEKLVMKTFQRDTKTWREWAMGEVVQRVYKAYVDRCEGREPKEKVSERIRAFLDGCGIEYDAGNLPVLDQPASKIKENGGPYDAANEFCGILFGKQSKRTMDRIRKVKLEAFLLRDFEVLPPLLDIGKEPAKTQTRKFAMQVMEEILTAPGMLAEKFIHYFGMERDELARLLVLEEISKNPGKLIEEWYKDGGQDSAQ